MIVTRGLGRAAVLGSIVVFGMGVDRTVEAAFSGGNARIGATPLADVIERVGALALAQDTRFGEAIAAQGHGRVGGALLPERNGLVGADGLADTDERIGSTVLAVHVRIGGAVLKKH